MGSEVSSAPGPAPRGRRPARSPLLTPGKAREPSGRARTVTSEQSRDRRCSKNAGSVSGGSTEARNCTSGKRGNCAETSVGTDQSWDIGGSIVGRGLPPAMGGASVGRGGGSWGGGFGQAWGGAPGVGASVGREGFVGRGGLPG